MRPTVTLRLVFALVLALLLPTRGTAQDLVARVDRTQLAVGESLQLAVVYSGPGNVSIGLPEGDDFDVVGEMTSSSFTYRGRTATSQVTKTFTLVARREGTLSIGRVPVRTDAGLRYTDAIPIVAVATPGSPQQPNAPPQRPSVAPVRPSQSVATTTDAMGARGFVPLPSSGAMFRGALPSEPLSRPFIVAQVSDNQPVIGQQLVIDYLLFTPAMWLSLEALDLVEPPFDNFWFRDITEDRHGRRNRMSEVVGGEIYDVQILRSFVAVPLQTGELSVPPIQLTLMTRSRQRNGITVASTPLLLEVSDVPSDGRPDGFVEANVGAMTLDVAASTTSARVGDAVTLTLRMTGIGLDSRLVAPAIEAQPGLRVIAGPTETSMLVDSSGWLRAMVRSEITIVAEREGDWQIGPLKVAYFDPLTDEFGEAVAAPVTITVRGNNPNAAPAAEPSDASATDPQLWHHALPAERDWQRGTSGARDVFVPTRGYFALLAAPPAIWLATWLAAAWRERRRRRQPERSRRSAGATALAAIDSSQGEAAEILRIVRTYLADRAARPLLGASRSELVRVAHELFGARADALESVLEQAELARYAQAATPELKAAARAAIVQCEEAHR